MNESLDNKISVMLTDRINCERTENKKLFADKLVQKIVYTFVGLICTGIVVATVAFILKTIQGE